MIGIINFGLGNIGSIINALNKISEKCFLINGISDFQKAEKLILPGVGSFKMGMKMLGERGFDNQIRKTVIHDKKPILGICLGMQLFATSSEEDGLNPGLNLIKAEVKKVKYLNGFSIPHVGWNKIKQEKKNPIFNDIPDNTDFYFVHSYHLVVKEKNIIIGKTTYSEDFNSIILSKNILGIQPHPEKSQFHGLKFLKNFCTSSIKE